MPPRSAMTTAQTYIYQLRKSLRAELGVERPEQLIATCPPGYILRIEKDQLDANVFQQLTLEGREFFSAGRIPEAAERLHEALSMWHGPALANVTPGRVLQGYVAQLEELKTSVLEMRINADMQLGRHRYLISELSSLVAAHPLNEWMHAQLMRALGRSGRRGDALNAYQRARQILNRELGLEPSHELRQVQQEVLTSSGRDRPAFAMAR
jgi:DNA-binding SARP family transcriptional activator